MQDGNEIPEEIDLTHIVKESPVVSENYKTEAPPRQYGIVAIILGCAIILVIMGLVWLLLQPGTPNVPANLPLPGSIPPKIVQPKLNQTK